jgi:hypothetical protein
MINVLTLFPISIPLFDPNELQKEILKIALINSAKKKLQAHKNVGEENQLLEKRLIKVFK